MMETFGPHSASPIEVCEQKVLSCDLFIGLIGYHFGASPQGLQESFTQLEYQWSHDIEQLIWVAPSGAPLAQTEQPGIDLDKQRAFRDSILSGPAARTVVMDVETWAGPYPLANSVLLALFKRLRAPGYTEEQHRVKLRLREREIRSELEHAAAGRLKEREEQLEKQAQEVRERLNNLQADFAATNAVLLQTREELARLDNWVGRQKLRDALDALDVGDASMAQEILTEVSRSWQERMRDPQYEAAKAEFELGKIAESQRNWHRAADHFSRSSGWQNENAEYRMRLAIAHLRAGDTHAAFVHGKAALAMGMKVRKWPSVEVLELQYDFALILSHTGTDSAELQALVRVCTDLAQELYGFDTAQCRYYFARRAEFLTGKKLAFRSDRKP